MEKLWCVKLYTYVKVLYLDYQLTRYYVALASVPLG